MVTGTRATTALVPARPWARPTKVMPWPCVVWVVVMMMMARRVVSAVRVGVQVEVIPMFGRGMDV